MQLLSRSPPEGDIIKKKKKTNNFILKKKKEDIKKRAVQCYRNPNCIGVFYKKGQF